MPNILIVEDEEADAKLLEVIVKSLGAKFIPVMAKTGLEAIEAAKKLGGIQMILLDINLPGYISGKNLLFRKEIEGIPVILVSGIEEIDLKLMKIKFPNVKEYMQKPIDQDKLRNVIMAYLK